MRKDIIVNKVFTDYVIDNVENNRFVIEPVNQNENFNQVRNYLDFTKTDTLLKTTNPETGELFRTTKEHRDYYTNLKDGYYGNTLADSYYSVAFAEMKRVQAAELKTANEVEADYNVLEKVELKHAHEKAVFNFYDKVILNQTPSQEDYQSLEDTLIAFKSFDNPNFKAELHFEEQRLIKSENNLPDVDNRVKLNDNEELEPVIQPVIKEDKTHNWDLDTVPTEPPAKAKVEVSQEDYNPFEPESIAEWKKTHNFDSELEKVKNSPEVKAVVADIFTKPRAEYQPTNFGPSDSQKTLSNALESEKNPYIMKNWDSQPDIVKTNIFNQEQRMKESGTSFNSMIPEENNKAMTEEYYTKHPERKVVAEQAQAIKQGNKIEVQPQPEQINEQKQQVLNNVQKMRMKLS